MNEITDQWVTVPVAAGLLGVSRQRVSQLVSAGKLVALRLSPKLTMVSRASVADRLSAKKNRGDHKTLDTGQCPA